jgi:hypothetical protein
MIRLVNNWMTGRKAALAQQWLATVGQLGQVVSAIPFAAGLAAFGWTIGFSSLAVTGFCAAVFVFIAGLDSPSRIQIKSSPLSAVVAALRLNVKRAPVRAGFWIHFLTQSSGNVFALLWGVPFLVEANGKSAAFASACLTLFVLTNASFGPVVGLLTARFPARRPQLVFLTGLAIIGAWMVVLLIDSPLPDLAVVALVVIIGLGGPVSMVAFDYSRTYVANTELGAANGFINIGGFLAGLLMIGSVGLVLDFTQALEPGSGMFDPEHFRLAMSIQILVVGFGLLMFRREQRQIRHSDLQSDSSRSAK